MKSALILLLFATNIVQAWECPEFKEEKNINQLWELRPSVFVATPVSGSYDTDERTYKYELDVEKVLKGDVPRRVSVRGDWSLQLALAEKSIFFIKGYDIDFCDHVLPFDFLWVERDDMPERKEYVKRIIDLSGYKP